MAQPKKTIKVNEIRTRDFVTMGENLHGKGGPHKNLKRYNRKANWDWDWERFVEENTSEAV